MVPRSSGVHSRAWLKARVQTEHTKSTLVPSPGPSRSLPGGSSAPRAAVAPGSHQYPGSGITHTPHVVIRDIYFHLSKNNPGKVIHTSTTEVRSCPASTSCALSGLTLSKIQIDKLYALQWSKELSHSESCTLTYLLSHSSLILSGHRILIRCTVAFPGQATRQWLGQIDFKLSLNDPVSFLVPCHLISL